MRRGSREGACIKPIGEYCASWGLLYAQTVLPRNIQDQIDEGSSDPVSGSRWAKGEVGGKRLLRVPMSN